jgi:hypothetical protein
VDGVFFLLSDLCGAFYYTPEKQACYHYYGRHDVPLFWENNNIYTEDWAYWMNRLNAIIRMASWSPNVADWIRMDEVKYGIGMVRDIQTFFDVFGIHVKEQWVEGNLCRFMGQPMQKEFIPHLRKNGISIDYDTISFRFVDKWKDV